MHAKAFPELNRSKLEFMGFVQYRSGAEYHRNNPELSKALHKAVAQGPGYISPRIRLCWRTVR